MCEPISAGTAATAALSLSAASAVAQVGGAVMQINETNEKAAENRRSAVDAYILKTAQGQKRTLQEQEAVTERRQDASGRVRSAKSRATTSAAAGNVQGKNVDQLLADFERSESLYLNRSGKNLELTRDAINDNMKGLEAEANNRINSIPTAGMGQLFGAVLSGAQKVGGTYLSVQDDLWDDTAPAGGS